MQEKPLAKVGDFIKAKAKESNACYTYYKYDEDVQQMLQKLYDALWRFNLYDSQIIYVLGEALTPFSYKK